MSKDQSASFELNEVAEGIGNCLGSGSGLLEKRDVLLEEGGMVTPDFIP